MILKKSGFVVKSCFLYTKQKTVSFDWNWLFLKVSCFEVEKALKEYQDFLE